MDRRTFLTGLWGASAALSAKMTGPIPMGLNTYCLRALQWHDAQLLDYCAAQRLDAIFLQDSQDPKRDDPAHWKWVRLRAKELGLHLETGGGAVLPKSPAGLDANTATLRRNIERASAMGSPIVRALLASDRASLPPGTIDQHIETAVKMFRAVRSQAMDAGLKIGLEIHKDLQAWEHKMLIDAAGKEFVGTYLDTGNPVFVMEDPMTTLETLGPYAVTVHLRDSLVYRHPDGIAVQWVPLGEGVIDFRAFIARVRELCTGVHVYIKPITGRPPYVHRIYDSKYWEPYPKARSAEFARFLTLAEKGRPYEGHIVIEDIPGRKTPEEFLPAIRLQQREHMERSIAYARKTLGLGVRS